MAEAVCSICYQSQSEDPCISKIHTVVESYSFHTSHKAISNPQPNLQFGLSGRPTSLPDGAANLGLAGSQAQPLASCIFSCANERNNFVLAGSSLHSTHATRRNSDGNAKAARCLNFEFCIDHKDGVGYMHAKLDKHVCGKRNSHSKTVIRPLKSV